MLGETAGAKRPMDLGGAFTKRRLRPNPDNGAVRISTAALNGIVEYEPRDLTVSVRAGMQFAELVRTLSNDGLMLPLDPPFFDRATVGGVVAANTAGPRRRLYGSARDQVIGIGFATVEGKLVNTGGMVVKNAAGFEMGKLLIGSMGTLAAMHTVNFRLAPQTPSTCSFVIVGDSLGDAMVARDRVLRGVLQPAAIDLLNPAAASRVGLDGYSLVVQAGGNKGVIGRYRQELPSARALDGDDETRLWERIREFTPAFLGEHPRGAMVRVSSTVSGIQDALAAVPGPALARAGTGTVYAGFDDCDDACRWAAEAAGKDIRAVVEYVPATGCSGDRWPLIGSDFAIMERIKQMFDPHRLLNRGALYGRL